MTEKYDQKVMIQTAQYKTVVESIILASSLPTLSYHFLIGISELPGGHSDVSEFICCLGGLPVLV